MKLVHVGEAGRERPGVLVGAEDYVDVGDRWSGFGEDFFAHDGLSELAALVPARVASGETRPLAGQRLGAPLARPHQILCIGLNYRDHAVETGQEEPAEPILFTKAPNTIIGPYDDVAIPPGSEKTDWEVELGVVVGSRACYLSSVEEAAASIAGYVLVNDVSERAFQLERGGQWSKGKSCPTFNPCGPWILTRDEVPDPLRLGLWLDVNGVRRQTGTTSDMIFTPAYIVWYLSQFLTLEPGDLINTGTPAGVGMGLSPQVFLADGDVVALGIDGLGEQRQHFRAVSR